MLTSQPMISLEKPSLIFDHRISDLREHASQANIDVEMRQLDAGTPRARIAIMANSSVAVMRGEYERAYHKIGEMPRNTLSIGVPDLNVGEFRWCGKVVSGDQITNFGLDSGFEGTSPAGFAGFVISIHHDVLQQTCEMLQLNVDFKSLLRRTEILPNSQCLAPKLRSQALSAFASSRHSDGSEAVEFFNFSGPASILSFLTKGQAHDVKTSYSARCSAARAIHEYLEDSDTLPLTVADLCSRIGVSAPTLYRAFQHEFGLSPKRYIQCRRLNGVRDQLMDGKGNPRIVDVANDWGFWHMGKFAADYKQLFGELPSETLGRISCRHRLTA